MLQSSYSLFLALLALILAFYYGRQQDGDLKRMTLILDGLLAREAALAPQERDKKVAVGFGACQDLFVKASSVLQSTGLQGKAKTDGARCRTLI